MGLVIYIAENIYSEKSFELCCPLDRMPRARTAREAIRSTTNSFQFALELNLIGKAVIYDQVAIHLWLIRQPTLHQEFKKS